MFYDSLWFCRRLTWTFIQFIGLDDVSYTQTLPLTDRSNLTPEWSPIKPRVYFRVYLGLTLGLPFENVGPLGVYFWFTRKFLLWSSVALKCEGDHSLSCHPTACNSCPLYIPNTHGASASGYSPDRSYTL